MPNTTSTYEPLVLVDTADLPEEEWLEYRRRGIGGSDAAAILGVSPFATARDLYYDKLKVVSYEDGESNWVQKKVGHLLEDLVAEIFHVKTGFEIYQVKKMFYHPVYTYMLADIDYFIRLPNGKTAILEIKTTNYNAKDHWWCDGQEIVPVNYEIQGRHYLVKLKLYRLATYVAYGDIGGARYYDDSVLNSKGKTVTEVLGVGKKYIPLLQTIDPGPNQLTMIKAFLRDNIRPDLELMKWCSKNDIGEEAYITVPLRYMTPHKLMRYATEQFATHRKTSYYAPGYYSMREMMSDYKDYLCMCELLEHDMKSSFVLFPNDLKAEHDRVNDMSRNDVSQAYDRRIAKMFEGLQHRYGYTQMGFVVIPPHSAKEITQEGDKLHHCVGRYVKDVVKNNTTILFIRKASAPKKPYCTVEVKHGDVIQARIQNNVVPPPKVKRFIESWKENVLYAPALERAA